MCKLVVQRVNHACVRVEGQVVGQINKGLCALVGIHRYDTGDISNILYNLLSKQNEARFDFTQKCITFNTDIRRNK